MRVLFVAGEVAPFSETSQAAHLARHAPEHLSELHGVEPRLLMPRYGTVSERRNRLHEVIRLSGAEVEAGGTTDTLKVKVASIPGIRLQVYFMDSPHFFKRKGVLADRKTGAEFEDNAARALYFARAALGTVEKLGWGPDVIHAVGSMAALVPSVLKNEHGASELFASTRSVFTPDDREQAVVLPAALAEDLGIADEADADLRDVGRAHADATAFDGDLPPAEDGAMQAAAATLYAQYEALRADVAA